MFFNKATSGTSEKTGISDPTPFGKKEEDHVESSMDQDSDNDGAPASVKSTMNNSFTFTLPKFLKYPENQDNEVVEVTQNDHLATRNAFVFSPPKTLDSGTAARRKGLRTLSPQKRRLSQTALARSRIKPSDRSIENTPVFQQLKANARTRSKEKIDYSITCLNVPKELLLKAKAKEYFGSFGQLVKIAHRPKRQIITVFYATKQYANAAYYGAGNFMGEKFEVEWTKDVQLPLVRQPQQQQQQQQRRLTKKKDSPSRLDPFMETADDDIKEELDALTALDTYNLHSQELATDEAASIGKQSPSRKARSQAAKEKRAEKALRVDKHEDRQQQVTPPSIPGATLEDLKSIIHRVALTSEEKYRVLEARDRLMRLQRVKAHSLATAKVTRGTCPDMCPEKERLMRESQRQVAPYEQLTGSSEYRINHAIAVKQYSRSSADQEEPMPHELRPVASLKMTMGYLLHEIADLCEEKGTNLAEWYHFMWDRTRGIRKDITQQELCCLDSVELVEQCARFHIICSERLCGEELAVFDEKINTENLTKCLQSLKYMYHDLHLKGVKCKNEPEFRGYIILLNLNNGNFMWELQRLPEWIQQSPEVRFAIKVYLAIEFNNYVQFFNLVKRTTYLNACILLRYFIHVRVQALSVMVKAYCRTTLSTTQYPLYELIDILGFEDEQEAEYFCKHLGLNVSGNDDLMMILNKDNFTKSNMSTIEQSRAANLVESKRQKLGWSIGRCIAGDALPERSYLNHKPHDSFNAKGLLMSRSLNAQDQDYDERDPYEFIDEDDSQMSSSSSVKDLDEIIQSPELDIKPWKDVTDSGPVFAPSQSFFSVIDKAPVASAKLPEASAAFTFTVPEPKPSIFFNKEKESPFGVPTVSFPTSNLFLQNRKSSFSPAEFPPVTSATLNFAKPKQEMYQPAVEKSLEAKKVLVDPKAEAKAKEREEEEKRKKALEEEEAERKRKEKERLEKRHEILREIEDRSERIVQQMLEEVVEEISSSIVKDEIDKITMFQTISETTTEELISQILEETCDEVLQEEIRIQRKIIEIYERLKNRMVMKYYNIWKQRTKKKKRQREALIDTPVWLQRTSVQEFARLLYHSEQELVIDEICRRKRFRAEEPIEKDSLCGLAPVEVIISQGFAENAKDQSERRIPCLNSFWKMVVSWPGSIDRYSMNSVWRIRKIMDRYFSSNPNGCDSCSECTKSDLVFAKCYKPNAFESLHICLRHIEGFPVGTRDETLIGTDALLFIIDTGIEPGSKTARRVTKTILSRDRLMPIPVIILNLEHRSKKSHLQEDVLFSELAVLLESGYISKYTMLSEKEELDNQESTILDMIQSSVLWLSMNKPSPVPLEMDYLKEVCGFCLTEEFWLRIQGDSNCNSNLAKALEEPNFLINLYNEAIAHLMDIILDPESFMYTDFAPEFKKGCLSRIEYNFPCSYEYFDSKWKNEEYREKVESIMNTFILPQWRFPWPATDIIELRNNVTNYCETILTDANYNAISCNIFSNCFFSLDFVSKSPSFVVVINEVVKEKIHSLDDNLTVVYNKNRLRRLQTSPWWFQSKAFSQFASRNTQKYLEEKNEYHSEKENTLAESLMDFSMDIDEHYSSILEKDVDSSKMSEDKERATEVDDIAKRLESQLNAQQLKCREFEEKLLKALEEN